MESNSQVDIEKIINEMKNRYKSKENIKSLINEIKNFQNELNNVNIDKIRNNIIHFIGLKEAIQDFLNESNDLNVDIQKKINKLSEIKGKIKIANEILRICDDLNRDYDLSNYTNEIYDKLSRIENENDNCVKSLCNKANSITELSEIIMKYNNLKESKTISHVKEALKTIYDEFNRSLYINDCDLEEMENLNEININNINIIKNSINDVKSAKNKIDIDCESLKIPKLKQLCLSAKDIVKNTFNDLNNMEDSDFKNIDEFIHKLTDIINKDYENPLKDIKKDVDELKEMLSKIGIEKDFQFIDISDLLDLLENTSDHIQQKMKDLGLDDIDMCLINTSRIGISMDELIDNFLANKCNEDFKLDKTEILNKIYELSKKKILVFKIG